MKKISLTLSLLILSSCQSYETEVPIDKQYVTDLTNQVCVEYPIVDKRNYLEGDPIELPLVSGGPCDRMIGAKLDDFKTFQNWVRDTIKKLEKQSTLP